jgi:hypothetical protein
MLGATLGLVWGLLVVCLSDGGSASLWAEVATRAIVVAFFVAVGAAAGLLLGWIIGLLRRT